MTELSDNLLNFLQPTNFKVVIDRKRYGNLEFFAQRVSHPSITIQNAPAAFKRISKISVPGDTLNFSDLSMDILVDEDLKSYNEMYNWLKYLVENNYKKPFDTSDDIKSEVDITLTIQNSHNNTNNRIRYIDCVPTSMGELTLESVSNEASVITFSVNFAIGYFELIN